MKKVLSTTIRTLALSCIAAFGFSTSAAFAAPSIMNGGFESVTNGPGFIGPAGTTNATGWTAGSGFGAIVPAGTADTTGIVLGGTPYYIWGPGANGGGVSNGLTASSPTGGNFLSSDADPMTAVMISQTLSGLTVGASYTLIFDYAAAQYRSTTPGQFQDGPSTSGWNVNFGTDVFQTAALSIGTHGFSGWQRASFTHTATSATEVLSFMAFGAPQGVPPAALLDGISLSENQSNVPVPATALLFAIGGIASLVSRKKKQA
jgi:hypothetical protein